LLDYGIRACGTVPCSSKDYTSSLNISKNRAVGILEWNFATGVVVREIHGTQKKRKKLWWSCPGGICLGHATGDGFFPAGQ